MLRAERCRTESEMCLRIVRMDPFHSLAPVSYLAPTIRYKRTVVPVSYLQPRIVIKRTLEEKVSPAASLGLIVFSSVAMWGGIVLGLRSLFF